MEWTDEAIILSARRHGEASLVATLLTRCHGRHNGLVRGGGGKQGRGVYQPGNRVAVQWKARLEEHLGLYTCDLLKADAARWLDDAARLAALSAACAMAEALLPEREPQGAVFKGLAAFIDALDQQSWPILYVHWELGLLRELGFGLDLSRCAATGRNDQLAYVSPKTGRAVSSSAGEAWRDKLLPLPAFLVGGGEADQPALIEALRLTGYFLERYVATMQRHGLPDARSRLVDRLQS